MYSQMLTGVISGVIVAVFWVGLGNWVRGRVQNVRVLRGLKSEVEGNKELYEFLIEHVRTDLDAGQEDLHNVPMMEQFSMEAYENAKSSGSLSKLSTELQDRLFSHYDSLGFANRQIGGRERWKIDGQNRENYHRMAMRLDRAILGTLLYIDPERFEDVERSKIDNLSKNYSEEDFEIITGQKQPETRIDFQTLRKEIDRTLQHYRILNKMI